MLTPNILGAVQARRVRTSQPQGQARIDWSNPITRGLIGLWVPSVGLTGVEGLGGTLAKFGAIYTVPGAPGLGWKTAGSNSTHYLTIPSLVSKITSEATLIMALSNGTTDDQGFCYIGSSSLSSHYPVGGGGLIYSSEFASTRWVNGVASKVDLTKPHVVGVQFKNGLQRFSQSGITLQTATNAANPDVTNSRLFESTNTGWGYSGKKNLVGIWNRYLSDVEIKSISDNPWQIFAPDDLFLPSPSTWTQSSQPQTPDYEIDPSMSVRLAYLPTTNTDYARNTNITLVGSPSKVTSLSGVATQLNSYANHIDISTAKGPLFTSPFRFLYGFTQAGSVTNGGSVFSLAGTFSTNNQIDVYTLTGGIVRADVYRSTGSAVTVDTTAILSTNISGCLELVFDGSGLQWFFNGLSVSSYVAFVGVRDAESATITVGFGAGATPNHDVSLFAVVADGGKVLSDNPWQIFKAKGPSLSQREYASPRQSKMLGTSDGAPATAVISGAPRRVRTKQPQGPARIDWSNPISRGLIGWLSPSGIFTGAGINHVSVVGASKSGLLLRGSSKSGSLDSSSLTIVANVSMDSNPAYNTQIIGIAFWVSNADRFDFGLISGGGGEIRPDIRTGTGTLVLNGVTINAPFTKHLRLTVDNWSTAYLYEGSNPVPLASNAAFGEGYKSDFRKALNVFPAASVSYLFLFDRVLSQPENDSLVANPWQVFAPDNSLIWTAP